MSESAAENSSQGTADTGTPRSDAQGWREPAERRARGLVAHGAGPMTDGTLAGVLRSSQNAVDALGRAVPVEAVIQGPGVALLAAGSESSEAVAAALAGGVRVLACGNSLRSADVPAERLLPGVGVVPAAIEHLARRQWDGWAYVRL